MRAHVERGAFEVHDEHGTRVQRGERADLKCVEHAEDVELPLLREVRCVGEEREGDVHAAKLAASRPVCDARTPV